MWHDQSSQHILLKYLLSKLKLGTPIFLIIRNTINDTIVFRDCDTKAKFCAIQKLNELLSRY